MKEARGEGKGIVYLVGAGPGDPDLISVKAERLLRNCDAVVYDNLVPDEVIVTLPPSVERHHVGKKSGDHTLPQSEINALLVRLASEGRTVVRLKGGDPFIFGRGGEEAQFLKAHDIPYEIVPGISAGTASMEYAGIPCTDRHTSSFVVFVSGHKAMEKSTSSVPWEWMGRMSDGTLVIYMGVAEVGSIVKKLMNAGMSPDLPAAAIERGTFSTQRTVITSLGHLPDRVAEHGLVPPTVFVIGNVVTLRDTIAWFGGKPLSGVRVMVTRPADQARPLYGLLREFGADVLPYPTIATEEDHDDAGWAALGALGGEKRWVVFTSENGVRYFLRQWQAGRGDIRSLSAYRIAAVGEGTARALGEHFLSTDFLPTIARTDELARQMRKSVDLEGGAVVRIRGNLGDDRVEKALEEAGAKVVPLRVYRTCTPEWSREFVQKLFAYPPDVILFTSGSTVDGLHELLTAAEVKRLTSGATIVSIGPHTSQVIRSHGMAVDIEAGEHTIQGMVEKLLAHYRMERQGDSPGIISG
jgi:uroporphyrinogen III methyltransferase/synthase